MLSSDPSDNTGKMHSADRVIVLEPIEGKATLSATGLTDNRLFTGENRLHAIMDPQTCIWTMKYDEGGLPAGLKGQQFTSFGKLLNYAREYYKRRNIEIKEVIS